MMKYFVILCLCLTVGVVLAQEQETTTEKRVARDLNMPPMQDFASSAADAMSKMASMAADGAQNFMKAAGSMIPGAGQQQPGESRRRRSPLENTQPPKPPRPQ